MMKAPSTGLSITQESQKKLPGTDLFKIVIVYIKSHDYHMIQPRTWP